MYEAIERNVRGTWLLFLLFAVVVVALGYALGETFDFGYGGVALAAGLALVGAWGSYYYSDRIVLAISRAGEAPRDQYAYLYNAVEGLAIAAGIPTPRIYLIDDSAPNAFATGRDPEHAAIAVTTGLLAKLNRLELEGVVAHEMAHIRNYDIRLATVATIMVGLVVMMSDIFRRSLFWGRPGRGRTRRDGGGAGIIALVGLILAVLAPLFAQLLRLAISRNREYLADASGAMLTRYPEGLASALEKIGADREPLEVANKATAHLYIINPLREWGGWLNERFNTHPPVEERVRRLRAM